MLRKYHKSFVFCIHLSYAIMHSLFAYLFFCIFVIKITKIIAMYCSCGSSCIAITKISVKTCRITFKRVSITWNLVSIINVLILHAVRQKLVSRQTCIFCSKCMLIISTRKFIHWYNMLVSGMTTAVVILWSPYITKIIKSSATGTSRRWYFSNSIFVEEINKDWSRN